MLTLFSAKRKKIAATDDELLNEFLKSQDLEVLGILYERYMHLVYGLCIKYLHNREESKDAVMQIFESLIIEIPKYEIKNFKSWLYVVSKNFCLMKIRKEKSEQKKEDKYFAEEIMESTIEMHPIEQEQQTDIQKKLKECIEKLKSEQKQCVQLFYFDNKCYKEIAGQLQLEERKVKSYIQNGKRNLKICLEKNAVLYEA